MRLCEEVGLRAYDFIFCSMEDRVAKRPKVGVVRVSFGQEKLTIPSGLTAREAIDFIASGSTKLVLEAVVNGSSVSLPDTFPLEDYTGWVYRVRPQVLVPRRFGAGHAIKDAKECYYVEPRHTDGILRDLRMGKYCVVCDRRQSGKTTTVHAIARQLEPEGIVPAYVGGLGGARGTWDSSTMWKCLCYQMHLACAASFREPEKEEVCTAETFSGYFHIKQLKYKVLLILDEADSLLNLSTECMDELFHTIRNIKSERDHYNLWAFLLVGVETVKDLLEGQYDRRTCAATEEYQPGSTPSRLSPFPHDHTTSVSAFEVDDIVELMEQANKEHERRISDIQMTATSIWQLTAGHKGLVGTCLAFMMQEEAFTHKAWLEVADSYKLGRHIFGQATYFRMMKHFRVQSQKHYDLLTDFLMAEELSFPSVTHLRDMLAEGVLVSREDNDVYVVKISSPLLRTAILRRCSIVDQRVDDPPTPHVVDRTWVICEAIRTLDGDSMCRMASGASSEYVHQFMFMCRIKAVLQVAYPFLGAVVLPEVKEVATGGSNRSRLRLDTLVRDHQQFPRFGFEYLVDGTWELLKAHYKKAVKYSRQHSAQIYLVHFAMGKDPLEIEPVDDSVYFWGVRFDPGQRTARVCTLDATGAREEFVLELKNWTGKLNFRDIV